MSRSCRTSLFCLTILVTMIPGCIRRQEEQAALTKDAPAELATDVSKAEILELDVAVADVAEPEPPTGLPIHSQVGSSIQWMVENGASVRKGDELVKLETAGLEKSVAELTAESHLARAALVRAESAVAATEIALAEYTEGLFPLHQEEVQVELLEAELQVKSAGDNRLEAELAAAHARLAKKRLDVLKNHTRPKRVQELRGAIAAAKADLQARAELTQLVQRRRDRVLEQLKLCSIKAPTDGRAILADVNGIRAGAIVRKGQVLIYLEAEE